MARLIALVVLLGVAPVAAAPSPTLVATDLDAGRVILCRPSGVPVVLAYTHSMFGGEVREEFVAGGDGRLRRLAMTTANPASAEYYAYDAPVVREGERFRVGVPVQEFPEVVVRVDRVGAQRLLVGERVVDLVAAAGDGHRVELDVRSVPTVERLVAGCR